MARVAERMALAAHALEKLHALTALESLSEVERDAMIQRFEFCFELLWKCAKDYLWEVEGIAANTPKKVIRHCGESGLLDETQVRTALVMADARNLTAHTYDEELAQEMAERIRGYERLLRQWHEAMKFHP